MCDPWRGALALVTILAVVGACGADPTAGKVEGPGNAEKAARSYSPNADPADFTTEVDNKYFPLKPGLAETEKSFTVRAPPKYASL